MYIQVSDIGDLLIFVYFGLHLQGAKTRKREISLIEAYALSKLRKEERIEWGYQRYLWEKEKLRQQEQQNAPKRLVSLVSPKYLNAIAVSVEISLPD
jgi:hypothetical protein